MMSSWYLKQLQANQIEILTKCWKSKIEVHCMNFQTRDQSNQLIYGVITSSKVRLLCCPQTIHIKHTSTKFQISEECLHLNASTQTKEMLPSLASPIESQRSRKLHYTEHEQAHSEVKDEP